ncbi:MAG TPA: hypothetical protein VF337_07315 [Candidatus Limnocylindrales bacterium]
MYSARSSGFTVAGTEVVETVAAGVDTGAAAGGGLACPRGAPELAAGFDSLAAAV